MNQWSATIATSYALRCNHFSSVRVKNGCRRHRGRQDREGPSGGGITRSCICTSSSEPLRLLTLEVVALGVYGERHDGNFIQPEFLRHADVPVCRGSQSLEAVDNPLMTPAFMNV
jgi:hypothetical protein